MIQYGFNPDSAAPIDRKCETEPLRSKVDGFLPLTRYRSTVLGEDTKPHSNDVRECKMTLKLHSRTPFAASGLRLAPGGFGLLRNPCLIESSLGSLASNGGKQNGEQSKRVQNKNRCRKGTQEGSWRSAPTFRRFNLTATQTCSRKKVAEQGCRQRNAHGAAGSRRGRDHAGGSTDFFGVYSA